MGYYNIFGLLVITLVDAMFIFMKLQLFVVLAFLSLKIRLKTQVLGNGRVLLLAYDELDREVLKLVLLQQ